MEKPSNDSEMTTGASVHNAPKAPRYYCHAYDYRKAKLVDFVRTFILVANVDTFHRSLPVSGVFEVFQTSDRYRAGLIMTQ
jgi:hypothetical protein